MRKVTEQQILTKRLRNKEARNTFVKRTEFVNKKKKQIIDNKMYLFDKNYDQSQFFSYDHNVLYQAIHSDDYQIYTQ